MHFDVIMRGKLHKRYEAVGFGFIKALGQILANVHRTEVTAIKCMGTTQVASEKYKPVYQTAWIGIAPPPLLKSLTEEQQAWFNHKKNEDAQSFRNEYPTEIYKEEMAETEITEPTVPEEIEGRAPAGCLMVGVLEETREVVINLDEDRTGHIVFSPEQARQLAALLIKKAGEAEE